LKIVVVVVDGGGAVVLVVVVGAAVVVGATVVLVGAEAREPSLVPQPAAPASSTRGTAIHRSRRYTIATMMML
jgi:hypothetical protein